MGNRSGTIDCLHCGSDFEPQHFNQKLCSDKCKSERNKSLCKKWDRNNKHKKKAYNERKYAENKDFYRENAFRERYKITLDEAREMLEEQGGLCCICFSPIDIDAPGINAECKGHVDHCHDTGMVRGILCRECNWGLGNFKDNPHIVFEAARYLRGFANA